MKMFKRCQVSVVSTLSQPCICDECVWQFDFLSYGVVLSVTRSVVMLSVLFLMIVVAVAQSQQKDSSLMHE
jgi:hypothetical protein